MDRERADFNRVMESLTIAFGRTVVPVQLPIGSEKSFTGVVDLVKMQAYTYEMGGNGKAKVGPIPDNMAERGQGRARAPGGVGCRRRRRADGRVLRKGTIAEEHIIAGLHNAIREDKIFPVLFASGLGNMGTDEVLDFIVDYMPTAVERGTDDSCADRRTMASRQCARSATPNRFRCTSSRPSAIPFSGRISFFKVFSGVLKNDATVQNFTRSTSEKFAHISVMQGKTAVPVTELHAGDIGAVAKLRDTLDRRHAGRQGRRRSSIRRSRLPSRPSPSPSSPRRAPTKTS